MFRSTLEKALQSHNLPQVPDFRKGLEWFNSAPLSFERELKGKIVVLDFWCYCCINCMHVLPELKHLEEKYKGKPVAFVGVHSPKFRNEKAPRHLLDAIVRCDIEHPVVNDPEMGLWRALGVRSWPTIAIISPKGEVLFQISGEGHEHVIEGAINILLNHYHEFNETPLPVLLEKDKEPHLSPLLYPGKIAIDNQDKRLFISDSGHNRILVTDLSGKLITIIGNGSRGFKDGSFKDAQFNSPQGLAFFEDVLYIADTENHALRACDLKKHQVVTLAGDGHQGKDYEGGKSGKRQPLSSPWGVAVSHVGDRLYIAMAGTHQIWDYLFKTGKIHAFSGSGHELNLNTDDIRHAAWAQPSGITAGDQALYIADSESSSIRAIELLEHKTDTLVGGDSQNPRNLFPFGDIDGRGDQAKLQHPLGVAWHNKLKNVVVADTYNHKIKLVNPHIKEIKTLECKFLDGPGRFYEPSGVAVTKDGHFIYVADTNHHLIRVIELSTKKVTTLDLRSIPLPGDEAEISVDETVRVNSPEMMPGAKVTFGIELSGAFSKEIPCRWQILDEPYLPFLIETKSGEFTPSKTVEITGIFEPDPRNEKVRIDVLTYLCDEGGACTPKAVRFEVHMQEGMEKEAYIPLTMESE